MVDNAHFNVIRYVNSKPITGELPAFKVDNPVLIKILQELQLRLIQENQTETSEQVCQ